MDMETDNKDSNTETVEHKEKAPLSKRPWTNSACEVEFKGPNGTSKSAWMKSVIDANGNVVCFGKTKDMKFIVDMENAYNAIFESLKSLKASTETAILLMKKYSHEEGEYDNGSRT